MKSKKRPFLWRSIAQASDALARLVVVMPLPCPSPPRFGEGLMPVQVLEVFLSSPRTLSCYKFNTRNLSLSPPTPSSHESELKRPTTGHDTSLLIFDELEYEPFTENRRQPGGGLKNSTAPFACNGLANAGTAQGVSELHACAPARARSVVIIF
jgi:hypothetical protein